MARRIRLVFEELMQQMPIPVLAQPDIHTVIEYSEAEESAVMAACCIGSAFDVTAKGEALPRKALQSAVSGMACAWDGNTERANRAAMRFRTA